MTRVDWYADKVVLLLEGITYDSLLRLAYMIEAEAKIGAPVDTGFLRNTIYVHSKKGSTFQARSQELKSKKTGSSSVHRTADGPASGDKDSIIVGVAALYAVYAEIRQPFLYPALQKLVRQFGAIIKAEASGKL